MLTMKTNFWLQSGMLATRRSIGSVQRIDDAGVNQGDEKG